MLSFPRIPMGCGKTGQPTTRRARTTVIAERFEPSPTSRPSRCGGWATHHGRRSCGAKVSSFCDWAAGYAFNYE